MATKPPNELPLGTASPTPVRVLEYLTDRKVSTPWLLRRIGTVSIVLGVISAVFAIGHVHHAAIISNPVPILANRVPGAFGPRAVINAVPDRDVRGLADTYAVLALAIGVLAIVLIVAGFLTLRHSRRWRLWHLMYAVPALTLRALSIVVYLRLAPRYLQTYPAGATHPPREINAMMIINWTVEIIYALLLLFLLNSKALRQMEERGMLN